MNEAICNTLTRIFTSTRKMYYEARKKADYEFAQNEILLNKIEMYLLIYCMKVRCKSLLILIILILRKKQYE